MQTQTSNTLHNAIMEAGSKDRLPMLALDKEVPISEGSHVTRTERYQETYKNVSQDIHDQLNVEAEAVQIILTGIDNDIYSTVGACSNACEMWKAIERANQDNSPRINRSAGYENQRIGNVAGAKETVEQADWRDDTDDDELEYQELEAHYIEEIDQNDDNNDLVNERELLASLIEKLKCKVDDKKNRNKFLETSNKVLVEKLKGAIEDFKNKNKSLESSNNHFKQANNKLSETNKLLYDDFKKSEAELAKRNSVEYASKMEIKCAQVRGDLISYKMESQKSFNKYTQTINDLNQTISEMKNKLCAQQETVSILSQQKEAQIKLYKTREDKELDKVIALENKVKANNLPQCGGLYPLKDLIFYLDILDRLTSFLKIDSKNLLDRVSSSKHRIL
nr:hypothetical protein [Tanacetum cinerariifolium]